MSQILTQDQIIAALDKLGRNLTEDINSTRLSPLFNKAIAENGWFTKDNIELALKAIIPGLLNESVLRKWITSYDLNKPADPKNIGIIMAGNIPLVGWHDLVSVLLTGHIALVKLSSKDKALPEFLIRSLKEIEPSLEDRIIIADKLSAFDAIIATGSNNTARYFEYYFGKYPHIFRSNRNSVAVLDGSENKEQLSAIGSDIFSFFGLGCRSVSKLFVPEGYSFDKFFGAIEQFAWLADHHKYRNNYDYQKSIYLLNKELHFDNGFLLLRESPSFASPMAVVYYEPYQNLDDLKLKLKDNKDSLQCIVSAMPQIENAIPPGCAQFPQPWDYADNVDTIKFLLSL